MTQLNLTGGARVGMANASWPLAKLRVNENILELNVSMVGNLVFKREDIISIEPYYSIPLIGRGVKIVHNVPKYKENVVFWTFKDPKDVIRQIDQTGFMDSSVSIDNKDISNYVVERQKQGAFPVRIPFIIGFVVIWNLFFLIDIQDFLSGASDFPELGKGAIGGCGFLFLVCLLTLISKGFRKIVLKEGRELKEISTLIYFLMFLSGTMMLSLSFWG